MTLSFFGIFAAGVATVLSPCVLPVAPILVGGLVVGEGTSRWARLRGAAWFALGFAGVFSLLGLGVSTLMEVVRPLRPALLGAAALMLALYGLRMTGVVQAGRRLAWMERTFGPRTAGRRATERPRPLVLGALFALTWTPCAGPVLGGVLTYVAAERASALGGALMLLAYAAGVAAPLVLLAAASDSVSPMLRGLRAHVGTIERALGVVLVGLAVAVLLRLAPQSSRGGAPPATARAELETIPGVQQLLFFHSAHCPTCRAMERVLPALERACGSERWRLERVDVDRAENDALVERFGVRAVPTTSLVDDHGGEVLHLVGYQSAERLRAALEREVAVACAADAPPPPSGGADSPVCRVGKAC